MYHPIIGLEVHIQLNTKTKLFCRCLNEYTPDEPNKNICPFCTGQPGALPVLNKEAVKKAIKFGVAVGAKIPKYTRWDRKNYFYPDLPAGYQISQYDNPIVEGGKIEFYIENKDTGEFQKSEVNLTRAHLEADAGKSLHVADKTLVDYNRSGVPLIEIVTEPEMRSGAEAIAFVNELQILIRTLGISEADLEKGQMRFDCNISLQTDDQKQKNSLPNYKVEIKNINSFRALGRAVEYEINRQTKLLDDNQEPIQETRGWRDDLNKSTSQRSKEEAHDYRYFPEPDLKILEIRDKDIPKLEDLPELPKAKRQKYLDMGLTLQSANTMVTHRKVGDYFDRVLDLETNKKNEKLTKTIANVISVNLIAKATKLEKAINELLSETKVLNLSKLFLEGRISNQGLQKAIDLAIEDPDTPIQELVEKNDILQITNDTALEAFVNAAIGSNPQAVEQYKAGKLEVIKFLIGQCMKESKGKGNPAKFKEILEKKLN